MTKGSLFVLVMAKFFFIIKEPMRTVAQRAVSTPFRISEQTGVKIFCVMIVMRGKLSGSSNKEANRAP
jgi:hypothetical protein